MLFELELFPMKMVIIEVYASTYGGNEPEKGNFYNNLNEVVTKMSKRKKFVVM